MNILISKNLTNWLFYAWRVTYNKDMRHSQKTGKNTIIVLRVFCFPFLLVVLKFGQTTKANKANFFLYRFHYQYFVIYLEITIFYNRHEKNTAEMSVCHKWVQRQAFDCPGLQKQVVCDNNKARLICVWLYE